MDVLTLVAVVLAVTWMALLVTETGQQAVVDQIVRQFESYGIDVSDARYASIERFAPYSGYAAAAIALVGTPFLALVVTGSIMLAFGRGQEHIIFRQALSIVAHAGVVWAAGRLMAAPIAWLNESISAPTNLASFLPMLEETGFAARVLGAIDVLTIWWTLVLAVGISVLYNRRWRPIAFSLWTLYGVIAVLLAIVIVWRGGS